MHQNAEGHLNEHNTQAKIKEWLTNHAFIESSQIRDSAGTGLVVDINGTGPDSPKPISIALRADIDGLKMAEGNPDLVYRTKTEYAHMCGHDGHTATLLLAAALINKQKSKIPSNCLIRLLFQPAEEGPGGALPMIEDNCLDKIDEVYGMHNVPNFPEGEIRLKEGPMMAAISGVKIKVKGQGGHSSVPHYFKDVISAGASIINNLHLIKSRCVDSRENFVLTVTQFHGGNCNNVLPDEAFMDGTMRCYSNDVFKSASEKVKQIAE